MKDLSIAIISASYYKKVCNLLYSGAVNSLKEKGCSHELFEVPGVFEVPLALKFINNLRKFDGFVILGCVIKGETDHYNFISQAVFSNILSIANSDNIAFGMGILTVNSEKQAIERADMNKGNKGKDAAFACLEMIKLKNLVLTNGLNNDKTY